MAAERGGRRRVWGLLSLPCALACSQQPEAAHPVPPAPAHPRHATPAERGSAFVGRAPPRQPQLDVRLLGIQVADDDGARRARVSPAHIARWVAFANDVYRPAGIRFLFDARDLLALRSTRINDLYDAGDAGWAEAKRAADAVAEGYPDRMVVFFRHGPGRRATGHGFSGTSINFVMMPGWEDDVHCGHEHLGSFAHELGHHLGLAHTFVQPFSEPVEAESFLARAGGDVRAFDGDGLPDTSPDPALLATECLDVQQVELGRVRIPLARRNIMSYYDQPDSLTAQQITRARWHLLLRRAYHLKLPKNQPAAAHEAEQLELVAQSGNRCAPQPMEPFDGDNWSGGQQLFCGADGPHSLTLRLPVARAGLQRLELYATRAPDFGVLEVLLDGQPLGVSFDAWALSVLASGAIPLGERRLAAGTHELTLVVRARNPASTGFHLGIDAVALIPLEPIS